MKKWIITFAVTGIIIGVCVLIFQATFREGPLVPGGYYFTDSTTVLTIDYGNSAPLTIIEVERGRTLAEYNPDYPDDYSTAYISFCSDELLDILKTARIQRSFDSHAPFLSRDVQYTIHITVFNNNSFRRINLYLGKNSWAAVDGRNYIILNADELITALNFAQSKIQVYGQRSQA